MAYPSKSAEINTVLNGLSLFPPTNWQDIGVKASFIEGDVQPAITIEEFEFILDAYLELKNWISAGNIFQGVPFSISVSSTAPLTLPNNTVFEGYIDLRDSNINDTEGRISANVRYKDDISSVSARLQALDYGYLFENGTFTNSDFTNCPYVVVKIDYTIEAFIQTITLYLMVKQLIELTRQIQEDIATIQGFLATSPPGAGAAIYATATALINIAFAAALLVEILKLGTDLILAFVQPKRTHKCISFKKLIEKVCNYLGYSFNTSINELDTYYYLPSNTNVDTYDDIRGFLAIPKSIENGLPNVLDFGYRCTEMFELVKNMFNGRFAVQNNTIEFHSELSPYWSSLSSYIFPDILEPAYSYNTGELNSNIFINFSTDIVDGYTIENFKGTNYQVITRQNTTTDQKGVIIENLEEINLPLALGNRKNKLNGFEKTLKFLAGVIDGVLNTLSALFPVTQPSNLAGQIQNKIGVLKVETNNHTVPKVLFLDDSGKIPANHRDLLSARYLWNNYINELSFIANNYRRQRKVFEGVEIPFGWSDFQKLVNNSYFVTQSGEEGKIIDIEWIISQDKAVVSYWVQKKYTDNLIETYIEAE
jgi:hypothetical protein